jgi:hypothetical protein
MGKAIDIILIILIAIVIITIAGVFFLNNNADNFFGIDNDQTINDDQDVNGDFPTYPDEEPESEPNSSGSSSSGSSGGGESNPGGNINPITGCATSSISYSIEDITIEETCNFYNNEICTDKTVTCSAEIHNLDSESDGIFKVILKFMEGDMANGIILESKSREFSVPAGQFEIFMETINLLGEEAGKQLNCFYNTEEPPSTDPC